MIVRLIAECDETDTFELDEDMTDEELTEMAAEFGTNCVTYKYEILTDEDKDEDMSGEAFRPSKMRDSWGV